MRTMATIAGGVLFTLTTGWAAVTPLDAPLPEGRETTITCELTVPPKEGEVPVLSGAKSREATKGTYTYKLYIPDGYSKEPQRRYPCLFTMSPGGGGGAGALMPYLKANKYVVVSLIEARNGPWEPIVGNFLAAHDDVVKRVRIQDGLKMATGFSGGARGSSVFVQLRPGFGGLLMLGAGAAMNNTGNHHLTGIRANRALFSVLMMGDQDGNNREVPRMKSGLAGERFRYVSFPGGHTTPSKELLEDALRWIEGNLYDHGPAVPALRSVYVQRFADHYEAYRGATGGWKRYQAADAAVRFAAARNLAVEPALAGKVRELQVEAARLRADPLIAREAQATDSLQRLLAGREKMPENRFASECQNLARMFAGTEAAARARELAEGK